MNYQKIYNNIIKNAEISSRKKLDKNDSNYRYYEKHHILPRCLGGNNHLNNLVLLTAREHFIAHKLLVLIYPNHKGAIFAFWRLATDKKGRHVSSRDYAYARELFNSIPKNKSIPTKQNMSKARKNKSYDIFYGDKANYMRDKRKKQTAGKNNPNSHKYIIFNSKLNMKWLCYGNLNIFCKEYHVSVRTFQLSRKNNSYVNFWKCEELNSDNDKDYIIFKPSIT